MAEIRPFAALRPVPELVSKIAELPYDVMSTQEARDILKENPLSFVRVSRAEADLPEGISESDPRVYGKARENLERYIAEGQMKQDPQPYYYIYRQQMGAYIQIGLVAAASLKEYKEGIIKRHELTRQNKETDRVNHILATKAQTGPVFLAYKSKGLLTAFLLEYMGSHMPVYNFVGDDKIRHTLYVISEPLKVKEVTRLFQQVPELYIADGHHRCAAALRVAEELGKRPGQTGKEEYNYVLAVIFPSNMLHILPYNRIVRNLGELSEEKFLEMVQEKFLMEKADRPVTPQAPHTFGMYISGQWYKLTAKPDTYPTEDPIHSLDVSILQDNLLAPVLGIDDPRTDPRIDFVGGVRGLGALEDAVDGEDATVAFSMYPTSMEDLMKIADESKLMPPKSTWFEPKLRSGLFIHKL